MTIRVTIDDTDKIAILASTGRYTAQEIVLYFEEKYNIGQIKRNLKTKNPEAFKMLRKETSRGGVKLKAILSEIFPNSKIEEETHVGERLRLDYYISEPYNIGFEFDGIQHSEYVPGLHKSEAEYIEGVERDAQKEELCKGRGITLVRVNHTDALTKALVEQRIELAGYGSGFIQDGFATAKEMHKVQQKKMNKIIAERKKEQYQKYKSSDSYRIQKDKQKEYQKAQYQRLKEWKKSLKK